MRGKHKMRKEIKCEFRGRTEYKKRKKITLNQVTFSHSFIDGAQQK